MRRPFAREKKIQPARTIAFWYAVAIGLSTACLMFPGATEPGRTTTFLQAFFTATSAVCVTGLTLVDTAPHWSMFGEITILLAIHVGGFGIVSIASIFGLAMSRQVRLKTRLFGFREVTAVR